MYNAYISDFLCFILQRYTYVSGDYILSIQLLSFTNPGEQLAAGELCCEARTNLNSTTCPNPCNTTLQICVRDVDHPVDDFICPVEELIVAARQLPMKLNPVNTGPWPVRYTDFMAQIILQDSFHFISIRFVHVQNVLLSSSCTACSLWYNLHQLSIYV